MARTLVSAALAALSLGSADPVSAQCSNEWRAGDGLPGTNGTIESLGLWDPDGAGPLTERIVAGGFLTVAGRTVVQHLAVLDPATGAWSSIGDANDRVYAIQQMPNGDLVVAGAFTSIGGVAADRIARWDGSTWSGLGSGADQDVEALALLPNGDLIAGGRFVVVGGVVANRVARWDGAAWSALAGGLDGYVVNMAVLTNGDLVVTGGFTNAGGVACSQIALWDGTGWDALGGGFQYGSGALAALPAGGFVVGGNFASAGGVPVVRVARWVAGTWSALGSGLPFVPGALIAAANGDVFVGSYWPETNGVQRWDGTSWSPISSELPGTVRSFVTLPNGDLVMGGRFLEPDANQPVFARNIARWDGTGWSGFGDWTIGRVEDIYRRGGTIVVSGRFRDPASPTGTTSVGLWNGDSLTPLPPPLAPGAQAVAIAANGDVLASVESPASRPSEVVRWDGASWTTLGGTFMKGSSPGSVLDLAVLPTGELLAAGDFSFVGTTAAIHVARWTGTAWVAMDAGLPPSNVLSKVNQLLVAPDGTVSACGWFGPSMPGAFRWNGSSWSAIGFPPGPVDTIAVDGPHTFAAGEFAIGASGPENRVLRWDGAAWTQVGPAAGTGPVGFFDMAVLPNGDLAVAGFFPSAVAATTRLARWDGASWSALGADPDGSFLTVELDVDGDLLCGGGFFAVGNQASVALAQLRSTCPATTMTAGAGCDDDALTASLPWTGAAWRADGTGFPGGALVVDVLGLQPTSLPLAVVFPTALPGCTLHVQPLLLGLQTAVAGGASTQLDLPDDPTLAGSVFRAQMVSLATSGALEVTATNALELTVGVF